MNVFLRFVAGFFLGSIAISTFEASAVLRWLAMAALLAVLVPSIMLNWVLVPLRLHRGAYYFASVSMPVAYTRQARAGGVFFGALALVRKTHIDPTEIQWLRSKFRCESPRGVGVSAAALLAAAEGRTDQARLLFESLDGLPKRDTPAQVRRVTREWLVADALRKGDWHRVQTIGLRSGGIPYRWCFLMGSLSQRLTHDPNARGDIGLWAIWSASPRRLMTYRWLRRALLCPRPAAVKPDDAKQDHEDALSAALDGHANALRAPTHTNVLADARAWDVALKDPAMRAFVERRVLALSASRSPEACLGELRSSVEGDLLAHVSLVSSTEPSSPLLEALMIRSRQRALDEIESVAGELKARTLNEKSLHVLDEWMEWGSLKSSCERLLHRANTQTRHTLFTIVYGPACNYAVWLFNRRTEKFLANSIFRWLLALASDVEDATAVTLLRKNVAAGEG